MKRAHWGSRLAFILAAAGSAIGLGNLWKFPYITGVNGGGAFVLIYLACILAVGIPILIAELYIGQKSQANAVDAFEVIHKKGSPWKGIGWLGLLSAFLILSFYSVVGGWILDFEWRSLMGEFHNSSDEVISSTLGGLFGNPLRQTIGHLVFMSATIAIVLGGVKNGLERWNKILMPSLLVLLGFLLLRSVFLDGFPQALSFMFAPDTDKLKWSGVLEAVGHSFFTLSLGMGAILTYGSYLDKKESLFKVAIQVAFLDTLIALMAGVVIFSIVFTYGIEPGVGPGLIFSTLPVLFAKLPGGYLISVAFFLLVTFAALTSAVSLLEVIVAYFSEHEHATRTKVTLIAGGVTFALGLLTVFSTNKMSDIFNILGTTNFFDLFDKLTSSYFLPIGGILMALFYGWVLGRQGVKDSLDHLPPVMQTAFLWTTRVVAPLAVIWVLYNKMAS